jgi:hypothetical protein
MNGIPLAYDQWAPADARWSSWVKPVLFHPKFRLVHSQVQPIPLPVHDATWAPASTDGWAIVVDAPGTEGLSIGLGLARRGYRPIPLYNGVPSRESPLIDVEPLITGLDSAGRELEGLGLSPDAPPAFLLDSRRMSGVVRPRAFDNRWVVTPQDLPSANRLRHHGITHVLVIGQPPLAEDLSAVLKRWQEGGVRLYQQFGPDRTTIDVPRPPRFRWLIERLGVMWGLRRSSAGGFGGYIPEPSKGGG